MPTPIKIANLSDEIDVKIRPISGYWEFENGVFTEQSNFYFGDKTNQDNPFLASIEIEHLGEKHWINYKLFGASIQSQSVEENKLKYSTSDFDIEYEVLDGQLKEKIILNYPINKREFGFTLKLSQYLEYKLENNEVIFFDIRTNEDLLKIPAPSMVDAVGRESSGLSYVFGTEGEYRSLSVVVDDEEFLREAIYPVVIDPTTTVISGSSTIGMNCIVADSAGWVYTAFQKSNSMYVRRVKDSVVQKWTGVSTGWKVSTDATAEATIHAGFTPFSGNSNPVMTIDASDNIYVAWTGKTTSTGKLNIKVSKWNGSTWTYTPSASIYPDASYNQNNPSIDVDPTTGYVYIFFDSSISGQNAVQYLYFDTLWHYGGLIRSGTGSSQTNHSVYIDSSGRRFVTFSQGILVLGKYENSTWSFLTLTGMKTTISSVSVDSQGNAHVFSCDDGSITGNTYMKVVNFSLSSIKNIINVAYTHSMPSLGIYIDSRDYIWLTWATYNDAYIYYPQYTYSTDGGSNFNSPTGILTDTYRVGIRRDKFNSLSSVYIAVSNDADVQLFSPIQTLNAPSDFSAIATNYKQIYCTWTNPFAITGAKIYNGATLLQTLSGNVNNTDLIVGTESIEPNQSYNLDVVIFDSMSTANHSNVSPVTLTLPPPTLSGTAQSSSRILWSFNQYSDIIEYILYDSTDTRIGRIIKEGEIWKAYWGYPVETLQATYSSPQIEQSRISISTTLNPSTDMTLKVTSKYGIYESAKDAETKTTLALPTYNDFLGIVNDINNITWKIDRL